MKTLLADQILATPDHRFSSYRGNASVSDYKKLKRSLKQAVIIDVDNVATNIRENLLQFHNQIRDPSDIENMAPPFPLMWIEFDGVFQSDFRNGVLVRAHAGSMLEAKRDYYKGKDVKWSLEMTVVRHDGLKFYISSQYVYFEVDRNGRFVQSGLEEQGILFYEYTLVRHDIMITWFMNNIPVFKSIELLHRRGETSGQNGGMEIGSAVSIKELIRHKTLKVIPGKSHPNADARNSSSSVRYALHLTRGHFKHYDESTKLFGKHVGTYWWSPSVRGSKDQGIITKDYAVLAPK
jgi:hypothetical protein